MSKIPSTDDRRTEVSGVRHTYRTLSLEEKEAVDEIEDQAQVLLDLIHHQEITNHHRPGQGHSYAQAKTKVAEAVFWAVHGVTNPEDET